VLALRPYTIDLTAGSTTLGSKILSFSSKREEKTSQKAVSIPKVRKTSFWVIFYDKS